MTNASAAGARHRSTNRRDRTIGAAAALGLIAAGLQAAPAAALTEVDRVRYQEQAALTCGGGNCVANFIHLRAKHALEVEQVRCHFSVQNGATHFAQTYYLPNDPNFTVPLAAIWQRTTGTVTAFTLDSSMRWTVPRGKKLVVANSYTGSSPNGLCIVAGTRVIFE
jgi:hypothetical protein